MTPRGVCMKLYSALYKLLSDMGIFIKALRQPEFSQKHLGHYHRAFFGAACQLGIDSYF